MHDMSADTLHTKVLLAPLDWGLGHATRLIPIIRYLIPRTEVHIAASGLGLELLKKNTDIQAHVTFHQLTDLHINYSGEGQNMIWHLMTQLPALLKKKKNDAKIIASLQGQYQYDIIISDNRYGVLASGAYNIFMTHQVQILSGKNRLMDNMLLNIHKRLYAAYNEMWIVDHPNIGKAIAPALSHPDKKTHQNAHYIGHLSQFNRLSTADNISESTVLVLLSGPEPARTELLLKLHDQALKMPKYKFTFITGAPINVELPEAKHIEVYGLLPSSDIITKMETCGLVICRSGYSTVMDLMVFEKKALLVPTPGQTEQEYIAQHLQSSRVCYNRTQNELNLQHDIPQAMTYSGFEGYDASINTLFKERLNAVLNSNKK